MTKWAQIGNWDDWDETNEAIRRMHDGLRLEPTAEPPVPNGTPPLTIVAPSQHVPSTPRQRIAELADRIRDGDFYAAGELRWRLNQAEKEDQ